MSMKVKNENFFCPFGRKKKNACLFVMRNRLCPIAPPPHTIKNKRTCSQLVGENTVENFACFLRGQMVYLK